jgi:hypothetical protein
VNHFSIGLAIKEYHCPPFSFLTAVTCVFFYLSVIGDVVSILYFNFLLRYVCGTVQFRIHYSSGGTPLLVGFTDSDWVGDPNDRKSTAGYVFSLGLGPVTWACKKQQAIALSSAEVEY